MEWQQIIGFYHVAKLKSFTRAAEATYRTQSALTQQVKSLEEELDCLLLDRIANRKIQLTPFGERLYTFAETLLREHDRLMEDISERKGLRVGKLRIAAPFTTLYHLLPEVVRKYSRQFPWVELSLLDRPQADVVQLVKKGEVDLGLALEKSVPDVLNKRRWKKVEAVMLATPMHPVLKARKVSIEMIARYPLILPPKNSEHSYRAGIEELFRRHGLNYFVIMESSNVELSAIYAEKGIGLSFATIVRGLPVFRQRKLGYVSLSGLIPPEHICVVTGRERNLKPHQEIFLEMLFSS